MHRLTQAQIEALQLVEVADPALDVSRLPSFLLAGPQRTGSTWLHEQLRHHPQVTMSQPKEVYFFNLLGNTEHGQYWTNQLDTYLQIFEEDEARVRQRRAECEQRFGEPFEPVAFGEATASYAAGIDDRQAADLLTLNPDIRAVIMVRNPIERAWSHAKLRFARHRAQPIDEFPEDEVLRWLGSNYIMSCGRFTELHDLWSQRIEPERLMFGNFDDILQRPEELLLDIMRFLGLRSDRRYLSPHSNQGRNPSQKTREIPEPYRSFLHRSFAGECESLQERFGFQPMG